MSSSRHHVLEHRLLEAMNRIRVLEQQLLERQELGAADLLDGAQPEADVKRLRAELEALKGSGAYRLGRLMVDSARDPRRLLGWPGIAVRWIGRKMHPGTVSREPLALLKLPSPVAYSDGEESGSHLGGELVELPCAQALPADPAQLRIAMVCDRFTWDSLAVECDLRMLHPDKWAEQVRDFKPHLVFVESAWTGLDGEWEGKVVSAGAEICSLAISCSHAGIPAIFWNKEDPLHFEAFLDVASLFDRVFTTDADSVPLYLRRLRNSRVGVLPFAVQPQLHHPFADVDEQREEGSFFAGAWYGHLVQRCRDFYQLADALALAGKFRIHDRNDGKGDVSRRYPQHFAPYLRPVVAYEKTPALYRGSRIGLSLNTIKQSSTMFARRALELVCTNTSVYSNYSRALRLLFGSLIKATDDGHTMLDWAKAELQDPESPQHRQRRLRAMRKVLAEHTWSVRLGAILAELRDETPVASLPEVLVLCQATDQGQLDRLVRMARCQRGVRTRLQVMCPQDLLVPDGVTRLDTVSLAQPVASLFGDSLVAVWSAHDAYGAYYLSDLTDCLKFKQGNVVGKACYLSARAGAWQLQGGEFEYRRVRRLAWRRSLAYGRYWQGTPGHILLCIEDGVFSGDGLLSADRESYREFAADDEQSVMESAAIDEGLSMVEVESFVKHLTGSVVPDRDSDLSGASLMDLFDKRSISAGISLAAKNSSMEIVSKLPVGASGAVFSGPFVGSTLHGERTVTGVRLEAEASAAVNVYLDELIDEDGTLGQRYLLLPGATIAVPANGAALAYRLAIGLEGPYVGYLRALTLGDSLPAPILLPGEGRLLVVVNGYPRTDDLYRNAFVHSRVKNYQRRGIGVDVVWVSSSLCRQSYEFDGVPVEICDAATLRSTLRVSRHKAIAVHFLDEMILAGIADAAQEVTTVVWVHGAEIQSWRRRSFNFTDQVALSAAQAQSDARLVFWRKLFAARPRQLGLAFVSRELASQAREDVGMELPEQAWRVIHNPIDTERFQFRTKPSEQRCKFLSIRPHASRIYANDQVAAVIHRLAMEPNFEQMTFTLVGDGDLWDENFESLRQYPNVSLHRGFLDAAGIASLHEEHGVFLVPTRGDTQGVSRDEAMASGLVPVTSKVGAVPEFVDDSCGFVCEPEDIEALASACIMLAADADTFAELSKRAAVRVRSQSAAELITELEVSALSLN